MDKCTIIRLIESGRSQRSVAKELTMNRRTVARYWKEYLQAKDQISLDPSDPIKKEALTSKPAYKARNRRPRSIHEILVSEGFDIGESTIRPMLEKRFRNKKNPLSSKYIL